MQYYAALEHLAARPSALDRAQEAPASQYGVPSRPDQLYADLATLQTREREGGREGGREREPWPERARLDSWFSTRSRGCARLD